ncbi:restriction endonuclease subunit S [Faecalibacterium sp. BCRC 81149]|jgi:type I restriction enzyme S subunit|uniref:restriction endonuclease subunit S n=1 Tax=Faecalibacterium sp. BCRC 81149 TaxID=2315463 RepID=UPI001FA6CEA2|nr:restriction endonuclease subunit S [Faecalibacterium sp. BCRC 81149]MCI3217574.1 restriction endonuclease subunit S [Faecalibacterium sp. BCRC 81149]
MAKLGEVCTIVSGSTPKTSVTSYWDGNIKWITPAELNEDTFYIMDSVRHITEEGKEKTGLSYLPTGTVILSSRAPIGKTAIAGCEMCCNQGFKNLICSDAIYNEYLYFFLKSKTDYLNSLGRGATFKEISKSIVESIEIPLPEVNQQKEIAEKFKKLEQLISLRKQQLSKLDELVKVRFVEMFGDFEFNPKEFLVYHLCELCDVGSSKRIYQEEQSISGIPFLKVADLNELIDTGKYSCSTFIPLERYEQLLHKELTPTENDILITSRGTLGKCYIVQSDDEFYFQDGMISWLSNFSPKVSSIYISYLFAQPYIQKQIESLQAGSTVAYLSIAMLKKINVILPPKKLQDDFAAFVERVDKQKQTVQQSLEKLELMKKALMQEYFG